MQMNPLGNSFGGMSPFNSGFYGAAPTAGLNINLNLSGIGSSGVGGIGNIGSSLGFPSDKISFSPFGNDPYNGGFSNPFGLGSGLSSLGMGNVPGFGGALNPAGSMFGGLMQQMQNQQQMMQMMMMMLMMMMQQQQNGFGGQQGNGALGSMPGLGGGAMSGFGGGTPGVGGGSAAPAGGGSGGGNVGGATPADPNAQIPGFGANPSKQQINQQLEAAAKKYGIPPNILKAVAWQESTWRPDAKSFDGQHGKGIMQIDDRYHQLARTNQVWDPVTNIDYGAKYLSDLYKKTGNWEAALKRYNGGSSYPPKIMKLAQEQPWTKYL